ncbi:MAG: hypothetical protein JNJ57_00705 [Saprospiraceae bacterium]|nr:hypothetical protein [Saprospiraceae bacterium]
MRPARFLFALLFGAAVLITFLKLLFFVVAVAAVVGTLYFGFRAASYFGQFRGQRQMAGYAGNYPPVQLGGNPWNYQPQQPFQFRQKQGFEKHIEVL